MRIMGQMSPTVGESAVVAETCDQKLVLFRCCCGSPSPQAMAAEAKGSVEGSVLFQIGVGLWM